MASDRPDARSRRRHGAPSGRLHGFGAGRQADISFSGSASHRREVLLARRRRRDARANLAPIRLGAAVVQRCRVRAAVRDSATAGRSAAQSARLRSDERAPSLQYGGIVRHQHQLAELRRRDDAVLLQPDGRTYRAELRLGRNRHGGRRAAGACVRPRQVDDGRQLLGRPYACHALRAAAAVDRRGICADRTRRAAESQQLCRCDDARRRQADNRAGSGRQPDRHQAARHQRRRLLQYQLSAPVRKPEHLDKHHRGLGDHRARLGARRCLRPDDWSRARGLGAARRDAAVPHRRLRHRLLGGSRRQPADARHGHRRRQHGGQGGPLRRPAIGDLGHLHHRRFERLGQLHAQFLYAARWPRPAGADPDR